MTRCLTSLCLLLLLLLPLASARAEPRSHLARFDGGTPAIVSPAGSDAIKANEAICLEFWIAAEKDAIGAAMTPVTLTAADATWSLTVDDTRQNIVLAAGAGSKPVTVPVDLTGGRMVHLGFTFAPSGTVIYVDGYELPALTGPGFLPRNGDGVVSLGLGGPGFKGTIGAARLWSTGMNDALMVASRNDSDTFTPQGGLPIEDFVMGQTETGQLSRPAVPAIGLWHQNGGGTTIPVQKTVPGRPDVDHGLFVDDEVFLSMFPSERPWAQFAFTTSNVKYGQQPGEGANAASTYTALQEFYLVKTPEFGVYSIEDENQFRIGQLKFRPSGRVFTVDGFPPPGVLTQGDLYKTLEVPDDGAQTQYYGDAWQVNDKPKNFENSVMGCYSSLHMNMFDLQEHGCNRRFFREPPAYSHRFETGRNNLTIPWGWKYINFSESRAHGFSAMATSSDGIGSGVSSAVGYSGSLAGVTYQHNETTEAERESIRENKSMRAYHDYVARRQSLVVDAKKMMLDPCFLRDIGRLTFGLVGSAPQMPAYFTLADTAEGECDALLDTPLSLDQFASRYADLYAYAVTYGARAVQRVDMTASSVAQMEEHGTNVSDGIDYSVKGSFQAPGTGLAMEFKLGAGFNRDKGQSDWNDVKSEASLDFDDLICVGGASCANSQVEVGDNPVPIFLDLRPVTDLLGPPYFTDPLVTVTARRALHDYFEQHAPPPVQSVPLMRMFEVALSNFQCDYAKLPGSGSYTNMGQTPLSPFFGGFRYSGIAAQTPVATINSFILTTDDPMKTTAILTLLQACKFSLLANAHVQFVAENGGSSQTAGAPHLLALPASANAPGLSDMVNNGTKSVIMASMFDAALGGGLDTHPNLYLRLTLDSATGDACAAPCGVPFWDPHHAVVNAGGPAPGPDFVAYPSFETIDLTTVKPGGGTFDGLVIARGFSKLTDASQDGLSYRVSVTVTLTEKNFAKAIGY